MIAMIGAHMPKFTQSIVTRMFLGVSVLGVISIALFGVFLMNLMSDALLDQEKQALVTVLQSRNQTISNYLEITQQQLISAAKNKTIIDTYDQFRQSFQQVANESAHTIESDVDWESELIEFYENEFLSKLNSSDGSTLDAQSLLPESKNGRMLQWMYIARNPHAVGEKHLLDASPEPSKYNAVHSEIHPGYRDYQKAFGYYDLFLFDLQGNLVYSVYKEIDFATNFIHGPHADSGLGHVYRKALEQEGEQTAVIYDYQPYLPSYNEPALFIATPIMRDDKKIGVTAFQLPGEQVSKTIGSVFGLGDTGESYLVGNDGLMRSQSRFSDTSTILSQSVPLFEFENVSTTEIQTKRMDSYRGKPVFVSYIGLNAPGLDWMLVTQIDEEELIRPANRLRRTIIISMAAMSFLLIAILYIGIRRQIARPVQELFRSAKKIERGDYETSVTLKNQGEFDVLAQAFNAMTRAIRDDIVEREQAMAEIQQLRGLIPICASCKKVRDVEGMWSEVESYISAHTDAEFSHSLCRECANQLLKDAGLEPDL
jgi:methyl-accepting chemotaxis protein